MKKFVPFFVQDMEYIESYFSDMAKHGLFLKKWPFFFAEFEQGEPQNRRYRVVPKGVDPEEKEIFEGSGWHYVCKNGADAMSIFCTDDETAPELFTDMGSYKVYMKKFIRSCMWNVVLIPILLFVWAFDFFRDFNWAEGPVHFFTDWFGLETIACYGSFSVVWIMLLISSIKTLCRIYKNREMQHDKPYRRALILRKITEVAVVVLLMLAMASMIQSFRTADITYNEIDQPVTLAELDSEAWVPLKDFIDNSEWGDDDFYYDAYRYSDFWIEHTNVASDSQDTYYSANYYELRFEQLAQPWLREELAMDKIDMEAIRMPSEEVDYMGYFADDDTQYLYIQNGKRIETILYRGSKDLKENLQLFIDDIKE